MALYNFFSWCLTYITVITVFFPVNVLLMALAYKIRNGGQKIDMEPKEFWWRSTFAALGLAVLSLILVGAAYLLIVGAELPAGQLHLVLFMVYLPAAVAYGFWIYALEDLLQGLSVLSLYILLPVLPLILAGRLTGMWRGLRQTLPWLMPPA